MRPLLARRRAADPAGADGVAEAPPAPAEGGSPPGRADRITVATRVAAVVVALGLVGVVLCGTAWWLAGHGSDADTAVARDDALAAARQIATNLQSLDHTSVDKGLDTWEQSATGPLLDEFRKNRQLYADQMRKAQASSTARVVDVALADFDRQAGKARAVASVDVRTSQTVNGTAGVPVTRQVRIQLDLVEVPDAGWKAAAAAPIRPVRQ